MIYYWKVGEIFFCIFWNCCKNFLSFFFFIHSILIARFHLFDIPLRMKNRNVFSFVALTLQIFFTSDVDCIVNTIVPFELLYNDSFVFLSSLYICLLTISRIYLVLWNIFAVKYYKKVDGMFFSSAFFFCFSILITFQIFSTSDVEAPSDQIIVSLVASVIIKISRFFFLHILQLHDFTWLRIKKLAKYFLSQS